MSDVRNLIIDEFRNVEVLEEKANKDGEKRMYLEGIFGQFGEVNQNGRVYQRDEMLAEVERYNKEEIKEKTAFSELQHPSRVDIDLERVCDLVTELKVDESNGYVYGKSVILDTPMGKVLKGIMQEGRVGKSSRCLGNVQESVMNNGTTGNLVSNMKLICFDSVHGPSVKSAMTDPLFEQREWILNESSGQWMERPFEQWEKKLQNIPKLNREEYLVECIATFLKDIKF